MIPKKIHYCWFGGAPKPQLADKCILSWKRLCPDYQIIEWNETNFDLDQHPYLRWCHNNQKWAFLSDFARLLIVKQYGGIYFDTDVELLQKPDELICYEAYYGFENRGNVNTGLGFGAEPNHITVNAMMEQYLQLEPDEKGAYPLVTCPDLNTNALKKLGLEINGERQNVAGAEIFPVEYFNPYDDPTGRLYKTENTISIHWYSKSWLDQKTIIRSKMTRPFHRIFGKNCFEWLKR